MNLAMWLGVAAFGALGALGRYAVGLVVWRRQASPFPMATLVVNLTGTLALGVLVGAAASDRVATLLGTGLLGGYTTFSTWMVETQRLAELSERRAVLANVVLPLAVGLAAAAVGWQAGQALR